MASISKYTRERMASALVKHRFKDAGEALCAESVSLFNALLDDAYDAQTRKLMSRLQKLHPNAFDHTTAIWLKARGMRFGVGDIWIGSKGYQFSAKAPARATLNKDRTSEDYTDGPLADRLTAFAMATKAMGEEMETAYRRALGTLEQFTTVKKLTEGWPEALPVIGHLIPEENRALPTVQVAAINDEFGLPPSDRLAA